MNIKQKITSAIAIGTMMAAVIAPASFAATNTVDIVDNGAGSANIVKLPTTNSKSVTQRNKTRVNTMVALKAKTGKNSTDLNTGGTNGITTGAASNDVGVNVTGGTNTNTPSECGCPSSTNNVTISGNGADSYNKVIITESNSSTVYQKNYTSVNTGVYANASTGGNSSSLNTNGDNSITTGDASNTVNVTVGGSSNTN